MSKPQTSRQSYRFILLMGLVSLFGDLAYEGARSVLGPYLFYLGASSTLVGLIIGFGEFLTQGIKLLSGLYADRTRAYWLLTILGYCLILALPALALTTRLSLVCALIIIERLGKGIRTPARDTLLSLATVHVGHGLGFGLHEALDQIGALLGPGIFVLALILGYGYQGGFALLLLPALACVALVCLAKRTHPGKHFHNKKEDKNNSPLPKTIWPYLCFVFASASGLLNWQLIAFYNTKTMALAKSTIPLLYAMAMGIDALAALFFGQLYDRTPKKALMTIPLLTMPIPFLAISNNFPALVCSTLLFGTVMGGHETILRAAVADLSQTDKRATAYGLFASCYGLAILTGSLTQGLLLDKAPTWVSPFCLVLESIALALLLCAKKNRTLQS